MAIVTLHHFIYLCILRLIQQFRPLYQSMLKRIVISNNNEKVIAFLDDIERKKEEMRKKVEKRLKERKQPKKS